MSFDKSVFSKLRLPKNEPNFCALTSRNRELCRFWQRHSYGYVQTYFNPIHHHQRTKPFRVVAIKEQPTGWGLVILHRRDGDDHHKISLARDLVTLLYFTTSQDPP